MLQSGACFKIMEIPKIWDLSNLEVPKINKTALLKSTQALQKLQRGWKKMNKWQSYVSLFLIDFRGRSQGHLLKFKKNKKHRARLVSVAKIGKFHDFQLSNRSQSPLFWWVFLNEINKILLRYCFNNYFEISQIYYVVKRYCFNNKLNNTGTIVSCIEFYIDFRGD